MFNFVFMVTLGIVIVTKVQGNDVATSYGGERMEKKKKSGDGRRIEGGRGTNEGRFLYISVFSSRREVEVELNGVKMVWERDPPIHPWQTSRGMTELEKNGAALFVSVYSLLDGHLLMKRTFNLYKYAHDLSLPPTLASISPGRLLIMAVKTDAALNMPRSTCRLFYELGATRAHLLPVRGYLAWVLITGGQTWGEAVSFQPQTISRVSQSPVKRQINKQMKELNEKDTRFRQEDCSTEASRHSCNNQDLVCEQSMMETSPEFSSPVHMEVLLPLLDEDCWGRREGRERSRVLFCRKYEGYGDLCNCANPAPLDYPERKLENSIIEDVPVGVAARSRPQDLYKCLVTVLRQPGASRRRLLVVRDGEEEEMTELLQLLQVKYVINQQLEGRMFPSPGVRISLHIRFVLHSLFHVAFPSSSKAIILEEDLLLAPDFFSYFNQTSWLLDADPSLYCVSAWNDLGALHVASRPDLAYRVETHAGYGWMVTRSFVDEVYDRWKTAEKDHDWDIWFRSTEVRGGRECVVPDVSRTYHAGATGAHINGLLSHIFFTAHPVTSTTDIKIQNVHRLIQTAYEEDLYRVLEGDNVLFLDNVKHPCSRDYVPKNFTAGPVVIFFSMTGKDHHLGWKKMGACLGVWNLDTRSHHRGLFRLTYYSTELYLIGYPYSDYSYIRGWWTHVVIEPGPREEVLLGERTIENRARYRLPHLEHLAPYLVVEGRREDAEFVSR
ncbi:protein O-linked-mannose beta-1,2-N-acetylglucosaminyltransferase 1-like [Eriocheir sinensis]|uniref:protein O-linked-mannose beta-1,2-N-acetylglucosaminyltransferase 1-like n=1 Tax=Eriocheir sinensis TaxID=95602 RepID=UPI0021C7BF27|nr:protein O-linked-mannose beta-1,2-N-acetylglucosaminyltransferase 1-like [Eriocheir sinensis]